MASSSSKPEAKQLRELLKQQQEPFILEIYLSERGCYKKKLSTSKAKYSIGSSGKLLKKNLRAVIFDKLFASKGLKTKNFVDENGKVSVIETERFFTASSTTVDHSCSNSDIDEREKKAVADSKFQWSSMEDSKQDSPQSVLEDMSTSFPIDNSRRVSNLFLSKLIMNESILSASLWNLLLQTKPGLRELQEADDDGSNSSLFSIPKRVLQQTKKVTFDYNNEKVIISEKIKDLGKRYGDELANIMKLLELDVMDSTQEWNDYEQQKKDIGLVIGNAITEEIITEVVMDMIFNVL